CEPMQGAGAQPTASYCMRNADSHETIATVGGLHVGNLGTMAAGTAEIDGPDTGSGTFPLMVKNSAGTILFAVSDSG
ncbi:hypothetical protein, partial [Acidisphaera rubrifaciens]|uniref:hypothetical protein n=1 Tax=Acidisphaera rubrifaciens TaxID=50715 RepID=UPI000662452E